MKQRYTGLGLGLTGAACLVLAGTGHAQDDAWGDFGGNFAAAESGPSAEALWARASVAEGQRLYESLCSGCHGVNGDGQGVAAASMYPKPRDLTLGEYRFRTTLTGTLPTRDDVMRTLALGLPGTAMPAWKPLLSDQQRRSLVLYLETLSDRFEQEGPGPVEVEVASLADPPELTPELIDRGKELYKELKCLDCHGEDGRGDGPSAHTEKNSDGSEADVFDFTYGVYKGGIGSGDVYRTFMTGLDGTPMPSFSDSIPEESDRWAIERYCQSLTRDRGLGFYLAQRPTWERPLAPEPDPVEE